MASLKTSVLSQNSPVFSTSNYEQFSPNRSSTCTSAAAKYDGASSRPSHILFSILMNDSDSHNNADSRSTAAEKSATLSESASSLGALQRKSPILAAAMMESSSSLDSGEASVESDSGYASNRIGLMDAKRAKDAVKDIRSGEDDSDSQVGYSRSSSGDGALCLDDISYNSSTQIRHNSTGSCPTARQTLLISDTYHTTKGCQNNEELVEQARNKLIHLSTNNGGPNAIWRSDYLFPSSFKSFSHPGTPPSPPRPEIVRKYSMGNQDLKRSRHPDHHGRDANPVDLSMKRKRSCVVPITSNNDCNDSTGDCSILRSALRGRSSTFSFGVQAHNIDLTEGKLAVSGTGSQECLALLNSRQRVTLAKRNLNPVKSRVLERLHAMVNFVHDLPEFNSLPANDQKALLTSSAHRLLLLFMAEVNLEFVVTSVHYDDDDGESVGMATGGDVSAKGGVATRRRLEMPTKRFVEGVQNFIAKCQAIAIRPSEYFFMRWIILFHSGANRLERSDVVAGLNTAARQDLQEIITDSHPTDKLRYSKLLLALHTVFGVNCAMLESLFCAPLNLAGGLEAFVYQLLRDYQEKACAMTLGSMDS